MSGSDGLNDAKQTCAMVSRAVHWGPIPDELQAEALRAARLLLAGDGTRGKADAIRALVAMGMLAERSDTNGVKLSIDERRLQLDERKFEKECEIEVRLKELEARAGVDGEQAKPA